MMEAKTEWEAGMNINWFKLQIRLLTVALVCGVLGEGVMADKPSREDLELQILQLKQENQKLKIEVLALKSQLANAREKLANMNPLTKDPKDAKDKTKPKAGDDKKVVLPPSKGTADLVYRSALDILKQLPEDAQPSPVSGWDTYRVKQAEKWIDGRKNDGILSSGGKVSRIRVIRDLNASDADRSWQVLVSIEPKQHQFHGVKITEFVQPRVLTLWGDEAFAKSAQTKLRKGKNIQYSGKINRLKVQAFNSKSAYMHIWIGEPKVEGLK